MATPNNAFKRLSKEFVQLSQNPPHQCSVQMINESINQWDVSLKGPASTPYENGTFHVIFDFPASYPMKPPNVKFTTPIYHVNVSMSQGGAICQDIVSKGWAPTLKAADLIDRLIDMLKMPNPDSPLDADIGEMYMTDQKKYIETAQAWTKKHAMT